MALINLGIEHKIVGISEIDKYAIASYNAMYGETKNYGDISKVEELDYADLWSYGFPCQDISLAGLQKGIVKGQTRSGLLYEVERLLQTAVEREREPKYLILENVKNLVSKKFMPDFQRWLDRLEELGYNNYWKVLDAQDYGIPQHRERVFVVSIRKEVDDGFEFPKPIQLEKRLKDLLEDSVDEKYYLSDKMIQGMINTNFEQYKLDKKLKQEDDIADTILARFAGAPQCIPIKNRTKKGYLEAEDGDGIDISGRMKFHRGTVQKGKTQTIKTSSNDVGVCVVGNYTPSGHEAGRVLDPKGLAPTVKENHGTVNAIAQREPTLIGGIGEKKSNNGTQHYRQDRIYDDKLSASVTTTLNPYYAVAMRGRKDDTGKYQQKVEMSDREQANALTSVQKDSMVSNSSQGILRIRKLTPKECWRLQGFKDEYFDKAAKVSSNAQLYKQAGNSICVAVLEYLFKQLLPTKSLEEDLDDLIDNL